MKIGLIGNGAIANYVCKTLDQQSHSIDAILVRAERVTENPKLYVGSVANLPDDLDLVVDCAGHSALIAHGPAVLRRGFDLVTVSLGALADVDTQDALQAAATEGRAKLHLASGAIGALDCLQAAAIGRLDAVTYVGRKPPAGWQGSPAADKIDLDALTVGAQVHFEGTARAAAIAYPKNANVAAAVAIAGIGFDATQVRLIADAGVSSNIHEITGKGEFGSFAFQIAGTALPDNPRSSALAAMSVLSKINSLANSVTL
ncbi:MAG: aspartate dehydrogenase [Paracoccaceae bacterium]